MRTSRRLQVQGLVVASALLLAGATAKADCVSGTPARKQQAADSSLSVLYESGQRFPDFLANAKARREGWLGLADSARISETLLARARQVGGSWRFLVVAIDACGDSMNSVPYLALLASSVPGLDLRIVLPTEGRPVQQAHLSLDGRSATPTIVLLDDKGADRGCIVELPRPIREWAHGLRGKVSTDSLRSGIRTFYAANRGEAMVTEAIEMLEAAKSGSRHCFTG
ncbi:MAG: thioredoxin family protein [Gemmatimonadaceae bacterium]|nr:thioredoxin family protein [Gemmatimonadaceae bacterium]